MTKSLSNKIFLKKQLYSLRMKEGTSILQHLNHSIGFLSDILALELKLEDEDKVLLLLSSLPLSYDHLATTVMYKNEILVLENVRQMFQNNELMKKTDSTKETSRLVIKEQRRDHKVENPRRVLKFLVEF